MREPEPSAEMLATLEAIDATLAGDPVDPEFADVAELALLVRAERPAPHDDFAQALDRRVRERFKPAPSGPPASKRRFRPGWWWWTLAPAGGLAAAIAAVVVLGSGGGSSGGAASNTSSGSSLQLKRPATSHSSASRAAPRFGRNTPSPSPGLRVPNARGRKLTQSSSLMLGVVPKRIEAAAQEVFNVVGDQNGFVDSSQVTAEGTGGYAHLQLSVPSLTLPQTMSSLSTLPYTRVLQRTDSVEDVTGQYRNARRHHNKKELKALRRKIAYSQISVNLQAYTPPPPRKHRHPHHSAFIPTAAHTALHVLEVIAGVALIALAVLVPLALVATLVWWIAATLRRHRREQALDAA